MRILAACALLACAPGLRAQGNVLLLIGDDIGVDRVAVYHAHPDPGRTPHLDALAERGILFRNAWSHPMCSPTRAAILTGRNPYQTGIGSPVLGSTGPGQIIGHTLAISEWSIPDVLRAGTDHAWTSVALGKWHLAEAGVAPLHPLRSGFDHHAGSLFNLGSYWNWPKTVDGQTAIERTYATTDTTDDALAAARRLPEPWFLWVAYNAAHKPYHAPPPELHHFDLHGDPQDSKSLHHRAMVEATDTEIGRLLGGLDPGLLARTTVIFAGDNGTQNSALDPPSPAGHGKGSVYEGGVHVPLIVAGPRVLRPGSECRALVQLSDLFATVAELAGLDARALVPSEVALDSVSLVPYLEDPDLPSRRATVFAEYFKPNGFGPWIEHRRAVRGPRFKLIEVVASGPGPSGGGNWTSVTQELYDLAADPWERRDLLTMGPLSGPAQAALTDLRRELARKQKP